MPTVRILGTYGVPPAYSGFESAVANVGGYLRDRGWRVIVYCQLSGTGPIRVDEHEGLARVLIREPRDGAVGRAHYDLIASRHAVHEHAAGDVCLTFGYNTGVLALLQRLRHIPHVINMDGMDWRRSRYGAAMQAALWTNEAFAGVLANRLVGDHPAVAEYLTTRYGASKVRMIPYGADAVAVAPTAPLRDLGVRAGGYATVICRPIPENSILEIVSAWSRRRRGIPLLVLGEYTEADAFHRRVRRAAGDEVIFPGPIFDQARVRSLRLHSALYLHGHTVGGTNPSLVEALAAGSPVIARDNVYNRWVAADAARYFLGEADLDPLITEAIADPRSLAELSAAGRVRHAQEFTTQRIGAAYEELLEECR